VSVPEWKLTGTGPALASLSTESGIFLAIQCIAAMLHTVDLFGIVQITQIPFQYVMSGTVEVITGDLLTVSGFAGVHTSSLAESTPLDDTAFLSTLCKHRPYSAVERPAAVSYTAALFFTSGFEAVTVMVETLLSAGNLTVIVTDFVVFIRVKDRLERFDGNPREDQ